MTKYSLKAQLCHFPSSLRESLIKQIQLFPVNARKSTIICQDYGGGGCKKLLTRDKGVKRLYTQLQ